jgi:transmembrane sensor
LINIMNDPINREALTQAANWFSVLYDASATDQDRQRWQLWLQESEEHQHAWRMVEQVSQRFHPVKANPEQGEQTLSRLRSGRVNRRAALGALAGISGAGLLSWYGFTKTSLGAGSNADFASQTGEIKALTLTDGTHLWLNSDSAINVSFDATQRSVHLIKGELFIQTAQDDRPFHVDTAQGTFTPIGTEFSVRQLDDQTQLSVFEGNVLATPIEAQGVTVAAGEQIHLEHHQTPQRHQVDKRRDSWRNGVLVADDIRLQDLIDELRPFKKGYIYLDDTLSDARVFGAFPLTKPQQSLSMLSQVLPITIEQPLPWITVIAPKESG